MAQEKLIIQPRELMLINEIFDDHSRRLRADGVSQCPVETCYSLVSLCLSESCGKCTPCRIGLSRLKDLLDNILNGDADSASIKLVEDTAKLLYDTADCAIGYEAGRTVLTAISVFRDEFLSHINNQGCISGFKNPIPCVAYCPAHVDVPSYVRLVKEERYDDAVKVIRNDNPFPSACALICEHPCEHHCRRTIVDDAVNIRGLKRMAVDNCSDVSAPKRLESTGKKVAVIGGGPSGLSAAYYLSLMGHDVTVYEQRKKAGGMLRYGIPAYRLPRHILDKDIEYIASAGVKIKTDVSIGKDISYDDIQANNDAIYLAIGAHLDNKLGIAGEEANGVVSAVELLRGIGDGVYPDFSGKDVVVVGGGNVAMDCTRSSARLGAKSVTCVYRRRKEDMTALPDEIEGAVEEGCKFATLMAPDRIEVDENGNVKGLWVRPQLISKVRSGRPGVVNADKEAVLLPADIIIVAIGQKIDSAYFEEKGVTTNRGRVSAHADGRVYHHLGLYAGGDCVTGPATAIKAIAAGKVAAMSIDAYLGYNHNVDADVKIPVPKAGSFPACGRVNLSERPAEERRNDFELMECGMTLEEAQQESSRCLGCDFFGYGSFRRER